MAAHLDRRALLAAGCATCAAALTSACGGSDSTRSAANGATGTGGAPSAAPSSAAAEGGGSGSSGGSGGGGSGGALARLADIPVGSAVAAKAPDGTKIVVARPTATTARAFSSRCTHAGCTVAPAGKELQCPCHGSVYAAATGAVLHGPAQDPLAPFAVVVKGGQVLPA